MGLLWEGCRAQEKSGVKWKVRPFLAKFRVEVLQLPCAMRWRKSGEKSYEASRARDTELSRNWLGKERKR
jgi:hypothetical protein